MKPFSLSFDKFDTDNKLTNTLTASEALSLNEWVCTNTKLHKRNSSRYEKSEVQIIATGRPSEYMDKTDKLNYLLGLVLSFTSYSDEPSTYLSVIKTACNGFQLVGEFTTYEEALLHLFRCKFDVVEKKETEIKYL